MGLSNVSPLRIGTRGSALALVQARLTFSHLQKAFPEDPAVQEAILVPITTTGDRIANRPLYDIGGKALFAKELQQALLANEIDIAVHSLKDMETHVPSGLILAAVLPREDARDVMVSFIAPSFQALPPGSSVGTCAPRRTAQIMHLRPDLVCVPIRGNVDSRIGKLQDAISKTGEGALHAIILALAGLRRLGREAEATWIFPETAMVPAAGQGAIALECREKDTRTRACLSAINHVDTQRCVTAERALVAALNGSCHTPIGGHATLLKDGRLSLRAMVAYPSGAPLYHTVQTGDDPVALGSAAAKNLTAQFAPDFWEKICAF